MVNIFLKFETYTAKTVVYIILIRIKSIHTLSEIAKDQQNGHMTNKTSTAYLFG